MIITLRSKAGRQIGWLSHLELLVLRIIEQDIILQTKRDIESLLI
jgi:hypothetical protein